MRMLESGAVFVPCAHNRLWAFTALVLGGALVSLACGEDSNGDPGASAAAGTTSTPNAGAGGTAQGGSPSGGSGSGAGVGGKPTTTAGTTSGGGGASASGSNSGGSAGAAPDPMPCDSADVECRPLAASAVCVGGEAACALVGDGTVKCWGKNGYGEIGSGADRSTDELPPALVKDLTDVESITCGDYHVCAVSKTGQVSCWGSGPALGIHENPMKPREVDGFVPALVPGLDDVKMISAGSSQTCALRGDGSVWCFFGPPKAVEGIDDATFVASGAQHSCAIVGSGSVKCWGRDQEGQLGDDPTTTDDVVLIKKTPVSVIGVTDAVALTLSNNFSCALRAGGKVSCWGKTDLIGESRSFENAAEDLEQAVSLVAGYGEMCAVLRDRSVQCFGDNTKGQLGDDEGAGRVEPAEVPGLSEVTGLSIKAGRVCASKEDGSVWCWGNIAGEKTPTPVEVMDL